MRVMTFNLRFENNDDGPNAWSNRKEKVIKLIRHYAPSILGTQEGKINQLKYLDDNLPEYRGNISHRIQDKTAQYPTLFFRKKDFEIIQEKEFWLSKTPDVFQSKSWDSAFPRMISCIKATFLENGRPVWAGVTHLDHIGKEARNQQAKIVAEWFNQKKEDLILMGDFNDSPASTVHKTLTAPETGLHDTWEMLGYKEDQKNFTYHRFDGVPEKFRMDWILVSSGFDVINAFIIKDKFNGFYPSDHFPYMVDLACISHRHALAG